MSKEELFYKCKMIVLTTEESPDGYMSAIDEISNLISSYASEKEQRISYLEEENSKLQEVLKNALQRRFVPNAMKRTRSDEERK